MNCRSLFLTTMLLPFLFSASLHAETELSRAEIAEIERQKAETGCREEGEGEGLEGSDLEDYVAVCTEDLLSLSIGNQVDIRQK